MPIDPDSFIIDNILYEDIDPIGAEIIGLRVSIIASGLFGLPIFVVRSILDLLSIGEES
jgi:hypothetical protein